MQYFFVLIILLFSLSSSLAQGEVDSLQIAKYNTEGKKYWGKRDYFKASESWLKELDIKKKYYGEEHQETSRTYHNIGAALDQLLLTKKSIYYYEKALRIRKKIFASNKKNKELEKLTTSTYKALLKLYTEQGDYDKAILLFEEYQNTISSDINSNTELFTNYAKILEKKGTSNLEQAIDIYKESIQIFKTKKDYHNTARTLYDLGNAYESTGDKKMALASYTESFDILYNVIQAYSEDIFKVSNNLGYLYIKINQLDKAKEYLDQTIDIGKNIQISNPNFPYLAYPYDNLGELHSKKGELKKGLEYYNKALNEFIIGFDDIKSKLINTDFTTLSTRGIKADMLQTLFARSQNLYKLGKKQEAIDNLHFTDQVINSLRQDISTEGANLHWIQKTRDIYQYASKLALELNDNETVFNFIEKSKSVLLFENIQKLQQLNINDLTPKLQEERNIILDKIQLSKNKLYSSGINKDSIQTQIKLLQSSLTEFDKNNFPKQSINLNAKEKILENFQTYLKTNNSIAINYFGNKEQLIALVIYPDKIESHIFSDLNKIQSTINKWQENISKNNYHTATAIQQQFDLSHQIFELIISPLNIPKDQQLLILPDGVLQGLPFEALTTKKYEKADFSSAPYFFLQNPIGYAYSASVQLTLSRKETSLSSSTLIIAPKKIDGLATLNSEEAINIQNLTKGELRLGDSASSINFMNNAKNYSTIHLSTHASSGENSEPWIAFSDKKLPLSELYNLQLQADLVSLSACETSKGEIIAGEGVMSLARGFSFAGVPQVVTSLWAVNENSTAQIMESFYANLQSNHTASQALHQAKINYIQNNSLDKASPYHWASITAWGHDAINNPNSQGQNIWFWIMLAAIGMLGVFMLGKGKGN